MMLLVPTAAERDDTGLPVGVVLLVAVHLLAFAVTYSAGPAMEHRLWQHGLVPGAFGAGRILTSMFLEAGFLLLFLNLAVLVAIGPALEDRLGTFGFVTAYLAFGVGAAVVYTVATTLWVPGAVVPPAVGAGGAVCGLLGCYLALFPRRRLRFGYLFLLRRGTVEARAPWGLAYYACASVAWLYAAGVGTRALPTYWGPLGGLVAGLGVGCLLRWLQPAQDALAATPRDSLTAALPVIRARAAKRPMVTLSSSDPLLVPPLRQEPATTAEMGRAEDRQGAALRSSRPWNRRRTRPLRRAEGKRPQASAEALSPVPGWRIAGRAGA